MGNTCCSNTADIGDEIKSLKPCQSQMISGLLFHSKDIYKIVKLQRTVKRFLLRRRAVENYLSICPPELNEIDIANVKVSLLKPESDPLCAENACPLRSFRLSEP